MDRRTPREASRTPWHASAVLVGSVLLCCAGAHAADEASRLTPQLFDAVVGLHADVPGTSRTSAYLGTHRDGAGIVIDADGLIVTIGYLVTEATEIQVTPNNGKPIPASLVGLDSDSGLALVRSAVPLGVKPMGLGRTKA